MKPILPIKPSKTALLAQTWLLIIWLAGCTTITGAQSTALPTTTQPPAMIIPTAILVLPTALPVPTATITPQMAVPVPMDTLVPPTAKPLPTTTPTPDWYPEDCYLVKEWTRYQYDVGVYLDIPSGWQAIDEENYDYTTFTNPESTCFFTLLFSHDDPTPELIEQIMTPPSSLLDTEDDNAIVWELPYENPPWTGWEYIYGPYGAGQPTPSADDYTGQELSIRVFNESIGKAVVIFTIWDYESQMLSQEVGYEEVINERFSFIEHIFMSVDTQE